MCVEVSNEGAEGDDVSRGMSRSRYGSSYSCKTYDIRGPRAGAGGAGTRYEYVLLVVRRRNPRGAGGQSCIVAGASGPPLVA